jgi:hypothetical protein
LQALSIPPDRCARGMSAISVSHSSTDGTAALATQGGAEPLEVSRAWGRWFGTELTIVQVEVEQVLHRGADQLPFRCEDLWPLCREVVLHRRPEFLLDEGPLLLLAIPVTGTEHTLALGAFLTHQPREDAELTRTAKAAGVEPAALRRWAARQTPIAASTLDRLARLVLAQSEQERRVSQLEGEIERISDHLCGTYEEISLIFRLSRNLTLSRREEELYSLALEWLHELIPAECIAIAFTSSDVAASEVLHGTCAPKQAMLHGRCPLDEQGLRRLIRVINPGGSLRPHVANRLLTRDATWPDPRVREMVVVPLTEGEQLFGWLAAVNHTKGGEFGTVEADLLSSVAAILGIHRGNSELYREKAELLANLVRALTSAIDAKDPYTCGHSDRVARVAVRLAQELGCSQETAETIHLSGLLHDVGKIGIDDQVLRKPGKLTPEEFEHIKTHTEIGYRMLLGIRQLEQVLPVVLHHHEAWDGSGYPHKLCGENIPFLARIVAVADAFDAMRSDRPYRAGMDDDKLDAILRNGAGGQWDARVVHAFFRARDDIRRIVSQPRDDFALKPAELTPRQRTHANGPAGA